MKSGVTNDDQSNSKLILFFPIATTRILLDNMLTIGKIVYPGMRVIKIESNRFDAIEIHNVEEEPKGYVNLLVRDIGTDRIFELTQILDAENKYFVWTILSIEYFIKSMEKRIMMRYIAGH